MIFGCYCWCVLSIPSLSVTQIQGTQSVLQVKTFSSKKTSICSFSKFFSIGIVFLHKMMNLWQHSHRQHTFTILRMSLCRPEYSHCPHPSVCLLFFLVALSASLPWSVHCRHQSAPATIHQSEIPFSRSIRLHHNHIQPLWPLTLSHRGPPNSLMLNSSHAKNGKR